MDEPNNIVVALFAIAGILAVIGVVLLYTEHTVSGAAQVSPSQYGYWTEVQQCLFPTLCKAPDESCATGLAVHNDGNKQGCVLSVNARIPYCGRFPIGVHGGEYCNYREEILRTRCVCPYG